MRNPANVPELKERLFAATDGRNACEELRALAKLAQKGNEEAKSCFGCLRDRRDDPPRAVVRLRGPRRRD